MSFYRYVAPDKSLREKCLTGFMVRILCRPHDVVMFTRKEPPKENSLSGQLPTHVTKKEVEKQARPGEIYGQAANRIKGLKDALNKV